MQNIRLLMTVKPEELLRDSIKQLMAIREWRRAPVLFNLLNSFRKSD